MKRALAGVARATLLLVALGAADVRADASGQSLLAAQTKLGGASRLVPEDVHLRWLARVPSRAAARAQGLLPVTDTLAVARGNRAELAGLGATGLDLRWAPPRQLWLDQAGPTVHLGDVTDDFGLSGQGVIVGIIDTGADLTHPALQNEDGTTRVAWLLSFNQKPLGLHEDLEALYGCSDDDSCAVYSREDINLLLEAGGGPRDNVGHGTHVLSTAAGRDADFPGIAPEAELVVVQAGGSSGSLSDADILLGARFIFDRAADAAKPVVINISLGSSFGAHDGSSSIEQGLAELSRGPGKAIVVAAGNDGGLYGGGNGRYPEPYGIHGEVEVPEGSSVHVSLLTPESKSREKLTGQAYVWISSSRGDELSLAFDSGKGPKTARVSPGQAAGFRSSDLGEEAPNDYDVTIFNSKSAKDLAVNEGSVVVVAGTWEPGRVFDLVLSGHGTARIWVSSGGQFAPAVTGTGILLPRARTGGTVGVPASHPDLIAVGASVNRASWRDYTGTEVDGGKVTVGGLAVFSSAGPNQLGNLKPDLLAPGEYLVAALSVAADPRDSSNAESQFTSNGNCYAPEVECLVVDDLHAVSSGTSMAAPIVTGAIALLLQRDPELTMIEVRRLLRAGTNAVKGETAFGSWTGTGVLDIVGALRAQDAALSGAAALPSAKKSRIILADTFAVPSPGPALQGLVVLRNGVDAPAAGFEKQRLRLEVEGGSGKLGKLSAGLVEFEVSAAVGSGARELTVSVFFDDEALATEVVPIGLDPLRARLGFDATGGGCQLSASSRPGALTLTLLLAVSALPLVRRRATQGKREA